MVTESERQKILKVFKECIVADPDLEIGPVTENPVPDKPGIWMPVAEELAYLGTSYEAAMLTAK